MIVVTNQSGVSRKIFPEKLVAEVHERTDAIAAADGARVDGVYYCTHTKLDDCQCRKPLPGLLERAANEHASICRVRSSWATAMATWNLHTQLAGVGILVLTGYGTRRVRMHHETWARQPDWVVEDLTEAVDVDASGAR